MHSILMGGNAAGAQRLPLELGLTQAGQESGSLPESGRGRKGECDRGEVLKLC